MYSFKNDYSEGAHKRILEAMLKTNLKQEDGYGEDSYTKKAVELIKGKIGIEELEVHLLQGGTQTNLIAISSFLRPHEAAISASTGHVLTHETGAIEATGHKVLSIYSEDGKLSSQGIKEILEEHTDEHMVKPKLVYISNPTEIGTIYNKEELQRLSSFCKENNLILYMDGARLASALTSEENDIKLSDIGKLVDAFYIGGTKSGALLGEALVIVKDELKEDFRFFMKQKGALMAKGRVLGIQFLELFKDELYFELGKHSNEMAAILSKNIEDLGYKFLVKAKTNQVFPIMPNKLIERLSEKYSFNIWSKVDEATSSIRLVTSWATEKNKVIEFIEDLKKYTN